MNAERWKGWTQATVGCTAVDTRDKGIRGNSYPFQGSGCLIAKMFAQNQIKLKCRNTGREHGFRQSWGPAVLAGLKHWCEGWEQMWHCQRNGKSHLWLACLTSVQLLRSTDSQTEMSPITITTESSFCSLTPQLCLPLFRIVVAESGNFLIVSVYFRRNQCV